MGLLLFILLVLLGAAILAIGVYMAIRRRRPGPT